MADELTNGAQASGDSTVLDERQHTENPLSDAAFNQKPEDKQEEAKEPAKLSNRDAINNALDEAEAKEKEAAEKPDADKGEKGKPAEEEAKAKDEKPVKTRGEDGKFAKAEQETDQGQKAEKSAAPEKDDATGQDGDKSRQSEGRHEPPARFLPKAKEVWANTPNPVKAEVARMAQEHETELKEYKQFRDDLKDYEQLAKQHNVTIKGQLDSYVAADRLLNQDFGRGIAGLAQRYGYEPVQAISAVLRAYGVTPQQLAQYATNNPDAMKAQPQQAQRTDPNAQKTSSEIEALRAEIASMKQEQTARGIIEPFRSARNESGQLLHPRYDELETDMVFFLNSGKIPASLSPQERLEAAYDMAERINPRSMTAVDDEPEAPAAKPAPVVDPRGQKSIKGAPTGGKDPSSTRHKNNRDAASAALQQFGI